MNKKDLIVKTARKTIDIETKTIQSLQHSINEDFVAVVETIYQADGRVVITGIGKSAIVAKKIVATLNSTGTPALFMHAADAIHGDLGMIQAEDVVLCISKSGETPEIKILVPLLKYHGAVLIGMVSQRNSYLGRQSQYVLYTPVAEEADPNNLAPTASTTAQMVMGDALAMGLLALKGFTSEDFALFHPGGALGKHLYLRVSDIYPQNARPSVHLDENLQQTILEMTSKCLGMTVVVDDQEEVVGIITDGDLRRMLERQQDFYQMKAQEIMSLSPKMIGRNELAVKALDMMTEHNITQLIVVEEKQYLGVVHLHDLIKEGLV